MANGLAAPPKGLEAGAGLGAGAGAVAGLPATQQREVVLRLENGGKTEGKIETTASVGAPGLHRIAPDVDGKP
jgi:hypothetical protein